MLSLTKENVTELRRIADGSTKHMLPLSALQRPIESLNDVIAYLYLAYLCLVSKLDTISAREWQASLKRAELPTFKQFIEFLNHRCQMLEATTKTNALVPSNT